MAVLNSATEAPVAVFDDADPAAVAEGLKDAGYYNAGQDCTAASRVIAGPKLSGYGKDLSASSLEDYTQIKHVLAKLG
jgi:acyl-CoA reductase-like NAD-dependent aldehyde dehydrogenase